MSDVECGRPRWCATYWWKVSPEAATPLPPGEYRIQIVEGGTYRNLASRRKYTVENIDPQEETVRYTYTRNGGERVERVGVPNDLAVVEAVGDAPGGVIESDLEVVA